ncbi:type I restriction enzyme S subunit [Cellulophaga sp. RHA_52]|uniref:restriction endonuclease subunit S n=1 Tax=Cellulophaga sp. RHA_52 TaxID=1250036 RepID=UPI00119A0C3C|nr:restriction endonuclease subunit S [Cellulophaga sp. RHA_52]TVZ08649.1 type I restriction enzyme S subunit [Cellulophaga sp. RHA_52]
MEKQLVPQLRFSEFEGNWFVKKYNKIFSFYSTNSLSREYLNYENGVVKNIHYGDIHTKFSTLFDIEKEKVPFVNTDVDLSKIKDENFCQEGDLLIADASEDYNDIGKTTEIINLNNEKLISGLHTFHARPNKFKMAIGFSGYLLQSWKVRKQVMTIAQGTKVLGLATSRLGEINLFITSIPEQQKIASFLSDVDAKITQLTKKKDLLEQYKKGIMQKIFNQELRFKDDNGNEFPKWQEKKLGEVCKLQGGYAFKSNQFKKQGIPIIRISNISNNNNFIDSNNLVYYDDFDINENFILKKDDLIVAMSGATTGKSSIYNLEVKGFVNQRVGVFRPQNNLLNKFLIQFVFSNEFIKQLDKVLVAGAQPNISSKDIETFIIPIPCLKEQTKIANFLSDIDIKIEALKTKIENSKTFKKGLLQQMFV